MRRLSDLLANELRSNGLTLGEYELLSILAGESQSQTSICDRVNQSVPTVSRRLQRFERAGWIARHHAPRDRRQLIVNVTKEGIEHLSIADRSVSSALAGLSHDRESSSECLFVSLGQRIERFLAVAKET